VRETANNKIKAQLKSPNTLVNQVRKHQTLGQWLDSEMKRTFQAANHGRVSDTRKKLERLLVKEPGEINTREQLVSIYLTHGHFAKAIKILDEGLEYAPENPDLITMKAKLLMGQGQSEAAIRLLKSDHPSIVTHPDFYATLASALESQDKMTEAGTYYKSLIKIDPNNGMYWLGYGISLEQAKQTLEAINAYKRASQNAVKEVAVRNQAEDRLKVLQG